MKVAIVCDWLITYAGSERVLEQMLKCYPDADLFAVVDFLPQGQCGFIMDKSVTTTSIQHYPLARRFYQKYLFKMPLAIEQLDLSAYDLVISSSHAVAKGVITGPDQLHLCYIHTPIRYAWDMQHQYLEESGLTHGPLSWAARRMLFSIRQWDVRTANGVDAFVANSRFIARRVWKVYRREASVIYPPVDVERFALHEKKENFYLTASRLTPYKKVDLIVQAFAAMPDRRLIVIGDGPEMKKIRRDATPNVTILGYQPSDVLKDYMQRARAFVFAAEEDFGIVPVEAQACGTPVIAFGKGGATETIKDGSTGIFFGEQTVESIIDAVQRFDGMTFDPQACRANAMRFALERFREEFSMFVENEWQLFCSRKEVHG
ncbi:glycosyltransferase family 4 protein [bacterium]|nr:glycosyltransferase family 4 protein [bacterium]